MWIMLRPTAEVQSASKYILNQTKKNHGKKYTIANIYYWLDNPNVYNTHRLSSFL